MFDGEHGFALRVLADGHAAHFERAHLHMNSGGMVDSFDDGVDGAIRDLIFSDDAAVGVGELDRDARRLIVVRGDAQRLQRPGSRGIISSAHDQRFDVAVEELLFLVGQCFEFVEQSIEFAIADVVRDSPTSCGRIIS